MTVEQYLERALTKDDEKKRALRILEELEGMSVYEAQELLETCSDAVTFAPVRCKS